MTIFFNAFHAPIGAHSSFTLGALGAAGGLGLELGGPARENVYIGVEDRRGGSYQALPFYAGGEDEAARYDHARAGETASRVRPFKRNAIKRDFNVGTDTWRAGDLTFTVFSPVMTVPDPETEAGTKRHLSFVLCPSVAAELTIDNSTGKRDREAFFGYAGANRPDAMREFDVVKGKNLRGIAHGRSTAIASSTPGVRSAQGFSIDAILGQREPLNDHFGLGGTALLRFTVPAGEKRTVRFAICFHRGGFVTSGVDASYYYFRFFKDIEAVARHALLRHLDYVKLARANDKRFANNDLTDDQRFQLIHAVRSYYGSTQLLDWDTKPFWVVNEGEYRMMNTFDLTVDQLFYEVRMNPWTVRNELDMFTERYRYTDQLHFPGGANEHPGGISFTHDMGMGNHVSRPGYSTYERFGLSGCFSHMTHEQLVNWVLCAAIYIHRTGDREWRKDKLLRFRQCLRSMEHRDHPRAEERNGVMGLDSSRTLDGSEITTYDSLDASLGQARNNVYMAVKCWAAYLALERVFSGTDCDREASLARLQAERCAATICGHVTADGTIPAIMGEDNDSRIIPAIEGLVFPWILGMREAVSERGRYGLLIKALKRHLAAVLREGVCLYPDGAWKLSSTADNSWLSKIYLCQFVARRVLGWKQDAAMRRADKAHVKWLLNEPNLEYAWSDQMTSGVAKGSKYYPRGVTAILWLEE